VANRLEHRIGNEAEHGLGVLGVVEHAILAAHLTLTVAIALIHSNLLKISYKNVISKQHLTQYIREEKMPFSIRK
jgi:hypothetical protein